MKKNELVHLHALLACLASDYLERGIATSTDFDSYRALGVSPTTLTASRDEHRRAVRTLAATLADRSGASAVAAEGSGATPGTTRG